MARYLVGASERWYLQPRFFVKLFWCLFSIGFIIALIIFSTKLTDPFWSNVVGSSPSGLLISTLFFYIIVVIATLLCYFDYLPNIRRLLVIGIVTVTLVTFILGFAYVGAFGTPGRRTHYIGIVTDYWVRYKDSDTDWIKWFYDHVIKDSGVDYIDEIYAYCDERTEDVGSTIVGLFVAWGLFHGIWLYFMFNGEVHTTTTTNEYAPTGSPIE
jgi:hypothetical protein